VLLVKVMGENGIDGSFALLEDETTSAANNIGTHKVARAFERFIFELPRSYDEISRGNITNFKVKIVLIHDLERPNGGITTALT